jgi:hypothetical protein
MEPPRGSFFWSNLCLLLMKPLRGSKKSEAATLA